MVSKLGLLVIGQSPRPEVEREFRRLVPNAKIVLRGCLDGLSPEQIKSLQPKDNDAGLFTRLPSGEGVRLSKNAIVEHGTAQLDFLERLGADAVVVLCTGEFPMWENRPVLLPSKMLKSVVLGLQPKGHLGVLSPLSSQTAHTTKRWSSDFHRVTAVAMSPNATPQEAVRAGTELAQVNPDLLVFDCVSYTHQMKRIVCSEVSKPGVLAITTVARVAAEMIE